MGPLAISRKIYRRQRPAQNHWTHFVSILDRRTLEHDAALDDDLDHGLYEMVLGDLAKKQSIFDVYAGPEFTAWRRSLAAVGEKADPCRTCRQKALEGPELQRMGRAVDARLSAIGVGVS